jgi:hypothetical protein
VRHQHGGRRTTEEGEPGFSGHPPEGQVWAAEPVLFEGPADQRRYVVYLALSVNGRVVAEDELLSALRHQMAQVLGDATGKPVLNVPLDLEVPRLRSGAPVVELKRDQQPSEDGHERGAIPVERIEPKAS